MAQLDITSTFRWEGKNGALVVVGGEVDTTGSIPRYQLPSGNMDLLGFWNASTNTPYLYNSAGISGDVYKCNYAGTVDLGAGPITFSSGDLVYYDGFVWGKISSNAVSSIYAINNYSFTATAGQTVYTFSYVPNQLSVYYNGSKLSKNQYDASGGGFITLNFSPIAGDIITVDAYVNTLASNITGGGVNGAITKWIGTNILTNAIAGTDYVIPAALNAYVPTFRQLTINGVSYDLSADRSWNITSMVYPSAGIPISTGSAWGTSIVDNSTNWNTAYASRISSLTTTGTSGAATLSGNVLNIPNYSLNLTGYVPYTGATSDLNLGTNNIYANAFFGGFLNITASGTQVVLTVLSAPKILVSGSGGQTIKLPNATTLPNGATYSFNNNQTAGAITVNNNSNTLVVSIPSGGYAEVILLDNSIAAGSWDRHFQAPANVSWSTNTLDYAGSITSATWNGTTIAINRGGTGATTASAALTNLGGIGLTSLSATTPLSYNNTTGAFSIQVANTSQSGYLSSTDWNTFNGKQGAITLTTTGTSGAATLVGNTLNIPQYSGGGITGTGTTNTIPKFTAASTIGNSNITDSGTLVTIASALTLSGSVTAASAIARGEYNNTTLVAAANSDTLVGLDINPTFTNGAFTGVNNYALRVTGISFLGFSNISSFTALNLSRFNGGLIISSANSGNNLTTNTQSISGSGSGNFDFNNSSGNGWFFNWIQNGSTAMRLSTGNNLLLNTTTDAGYKLDVNGTARVQGNVTVSLDQNNTTSLTIQNNTAGGSAQASLTVIANTKSAQFTKLSTGWTIYKNLNPGDLSIYNTSNNISILNDFSSGAINFAAGGSSTAQATLFSTGNFAIGTTTDVASSILTMNSTTKGFLPPRMTTTQKTAIGTPATGLVVYDTTLNKLSVYTGAAWETVTSL